MRTLMRWPASPLVGVCLMGLSGCGTNFDEVLYQAANATGRTLLDLFLTDFANTLADSFDQEDTPPSADEVSDDGGTTLPDGPPLGELIGDPETGESTFVSNNCAACHCADAAGGCALDAPSLVGVATETLDDRLRGDAAHAGGKFNLTDQDIVDMQAYFDRLDTDGG